MVQMQRVPARDGGAGIGQAGQDRPGRSAVPRQRSAGGGVLGSLMRGFESCLATLNWDLKQN